jgi:uroporphyrinogen decarboxylase
MYDIRFDDYIIQRLMGTTTPVDVKAEVECLRKLGFSMVTAHPLGAGKKEVAEPQGRRSYVDEWGRQYIVIDGVKFYARGTFSETDLDEKEWDPFAEVRYRDIKEVLKIAPDFAVIGRVGGTFERALLALGPSQFFMSLYDRPRFMRRLLKKINAYWIEVGKIEIELGVDAILLTDDLAYKSGPYLSPAHMADFIWPTFRERITAFRRVPVILHSDGNITSLLDSLVALGIHGIHSLEPTAGMDIGKVKQDYGDQLVLLGNIDCGALLTHGTAQEVQETVRRTIAQAAPGGGYFLSTSNGVHRGVRLGNLVAMCEACKKYGKYPISSLK